MHNIGWGDINPALDGKGGFLIILPPVARYGVPVIGIAIHDLVPDAEYVRVIVCLRCGQKCFGPGVFAHSDVMSSSPGRNKKTAGRTSSISLGTAACCKRGFRTV